jgi:MFS family permease
MAQSLSSGPGDHPPPDTPDHSMWRNSRLRVLMLVALVTFTSFGLTLSALPVWASQGGADLRWMGAVTTAMLLSTIALQLAVPMIVERVGVARLVAAGLVLLGVPAPLYLVAADLGWLVAVSVARGAGFGIMTVLGSTLAISIAPARRRGEAVGLYGLAIAVPTMVAVPTGVALALSDQFAWVAWGAVLPLVGLAAVRRLANSSSLAEAPPANQAPLGGEDVLRAARPSLVLFVVTFAGAGFLTFLPADVAAGANAVLAVWLFSLASAVARWRVGLLADRFGVHGLLLGSVLIGGTGLVCVAACLIGVLPVGLVALGSVLFGVGYGAAQNLTLLQAVARARRHDVASAVWNIGFDAGTAAGALLTGLLAGTALGVPGSFAVVGFATVTSALLVGWGRRAMTR